jgi:hypothetical protein
MGTKTIVVVPDMQIPYHDKTAVARMIQFVADFEPDALVNVGDDTDALETATWSKASATEYSDGLQEAFDQTRTIHTMFREAMGDGPYHISRSNHGDRTGRYIKRYAPALGSLRCLDLPELLGYKELGMIYHREPFQLAPGWVCAHGDEGSTSPIAGRTAGRLAEKWGTSVVCGHTHRAGLSPTSYGYSGVITRTVYGLEVGHLMDVSRASYLPGGHGNWQQAFGILYCTTLTTTPVLVPIHPGGQFIVEGVGYGL